jgi:phytanoyl-CoA dioxygenase PhyH
MMASRLSWVFAPFHFAALASGAKSFRDNPIIGSPTLNRAGLHIARVRLAYRMAEWRRRRLAPLISAEDRAAFQRDGFIMKGGFLPQADFAALQREVFSFAGAAREQLQGDALTRRIALDRMTVNHLPALRALCENPEWLGLIRYVGASWLEPLLYIQTIFSQIRVAPPDPQTRLHADAFHPSVKAWLFLSDVGEGDGPLVYVPGSHRPTLRRLAWERRASIGAAGSADFQCSRGSLRIAAAEVRRLGFAEPRRFAVPGNTLVVADTFGFHARGLSSHPSVRVEIWAYGRRNPFLPWLGLDPAALPLIKGRGVPLYWSVMDCGETLGLTRNPWRRAGPLTPLAPPAPGQI